MKNVSRNMISQRRSLTETTGSMMNLLKIPLQPKTSPLPRSSTSHAKPSIDGES